MDLTDGKLQFNAHNCVLILSKGVTANRDSVAPAKKPAITVAGPDIVPSALASMDLYWSNATNPVVYNQCPVNAFH